MSTFKNTLKGVWLLLCLFTTQFASAQTTGSFNTTINFMGGTRDLAVYVPTDYNAAKSYKLMICLHGLGDNITNYRNALINSLKWNTNFPNTIFVCPEANNVNQDFYMPAGGEDIIRQSMIYAKTNYTIDTTNIILQGFSLGGHSALRYGLDHYTMFKSLLLNTPAVQGVKEGLDKSFFPYTYDNAPQIPIYITHGLSDIAYEAPIDSMYRELILHDGIVRYYEIPGLGHAIPAFSKMANAPAFFDAPATTGYDADVAGVYVRPRSCNTQAPSVVLLRNTGSATLTEAKLQYGIGSQTTTYTWAGMLKPFQHTMVTLPAVNGSAGMNTITVKVLSLNSTQTDADASNDTRSANFQVMTQAMALPMVEGFEENVDPAPNWFLNVSGDFYTPWVIDSSVKRSGVASVSAFNTILYFDEAGRREELQSPLLDLSTAPRPQLKFDVAFNYHHYTPPYLIKDTLLADTLEVLISTDCGNTFKSLYKKGGRDLATFHDPILNPLNIQNSYIYPADSNWRTEKIDLSAYQGTQAILVFRYISGMGGSIYMDNVSVADRPSGINEVPAKAYQLYPNPAKDMVYITPGSERIQCVNVLDISGRSTMHINNETSGHAELGINTATLPAGIYFFEIMTAKGVSTQKVVINR